MHRVPCPGLPGAGKWFWLNFRSADSKACQEISAACSGPLVMEYLLKEAMRGPTAAEAVVHSEVMGALVQVSEVGIIVISWAVGSARENSPARGRIRWLVELEWVSG